MFGFIKKLFGGKPAEAAPASSDAECCGIKDCGHTQAPYKVEAPTLTEVVNSQPVVKETAPVVESKSAPAKKPAGKKPAGQKPAPKQGGAKKGGRKPKAKPAV